MAVGSDNILSKIVDRKQEEIEARQASCALTLLREQAESADPARGFLEALTGRMKARQPAVIAEIKKASPSKGIIREKFDPSDIAQSYEKHGACCLSVLTDIDFFQGSDEYLKHARKQTALPVLRKDFTISEYQVYEARAIGADCILLIASILDVAQLHDLNALAVSLGMDVLVEVHDEAELNKALTLSPGLVGINNRDLRTFDVDLDTTVRLLAEIPEEVSVVTESGIRSRDDVQYMQNKGVYGFLVGEAFMREPDPGAALGRLFG